MTTSTLPKETTSPVEKAEMVRRAATLIPTLKERAARCEQLRRIPEETVADFCAAGIHRMTQPLRFGGLGLEMDTVYEAAVELGRGCGSSAWMGSQWPLHNWMIGMWPEEAQQEYWAESHDVLSSTASAVVSSRIEPAQGGLRISGQWKFSSGVDYADWVMIMFPGGTCRDFLLIPKADYRLEDDWYVSGLCGSGSKAVIVEDAFVPQHRVLEGSLLGSSRTPGRELYGTTFYKLPLRTWLGWTLASPIIGMAQGVVELFEERMRGKVNTQTGERAIERPANQLRLAESSAEVDVARLLMRRDLHDLVAWGEAGVEIPLPERARIRRDIAYSVKLSVQAANRLFDASSAQAIYDSSPIQCVLRDINAASHSVALTWDEPAEQYARVRWGLPPHTYAI